MKALLHRVWERLHSSYWFIPTVLALLASALAVGGIRIDEAYRDDTLRGLGWIYAGGAEGARAVLSTIAGSIITVAGTTFSITVAALSLASAQYGPRLLENFMRDTGNQIVLGTFTATFLYCLLVLRSVRGMEDNTYVPHLSVTVGVALAVLSVGVLIYFIHHVTETIQVSKVIQLVAEDLNAAVTRLFPRQTDGKPVQPRSSLRLSATPIRHQGSGYVQQVDTEGLIGIAEAADCEITMLVRPGEYVAKGSLVASASPAVDERAGARICSAFTLGRTRTTYQDAEYAFLQMAEIGVRALSPGVNDPFTAIMCLDRITDAMLRLVARSLPDPELYDSKGRLCVITKPYDYEDLTEAAYRHIRECSDGFWQVERHMRRQIQKVLDQADDHRLRAALVKELEQLQPGG